MRCWEFCQELDQLMIKTGFNINPKGSLLRTGFDLRQTCILNGVFQ